MAVSGPHRLPGPRPAPRRGKGGHRQVPALMPGGPGLPARVHPGGQGRERGRHRSGRREEVDLVPGTCIGAPWSWSSRSAPSAKTTGLRTISGHRCRLSRSQPATRIRDPAATARTCTPATTAGGPLSPVPRGAMRTSTSPPLALGQRRGRNKAVNSPSRLASAAVTHSQAPRPGAAAPPGPARSRSSPPRHRPGSPTCADHRHCEVLPS